MPEYQCLWEAERRARIIQHVLYQQQLRQALGLPAHPRKTHCYGGAVGALPYTSCAPCYTSVRPNAVQAAQRAAQGHGGQPCRPYCDYPPARPRHPLLCLPDGLVQGYTPDHEVINELTDDDCSKLGLCQPVRSPSFFITSPLTLSAVKTSLPGLEDALQYPPQPWRDECGGRIYHRLANHDYFQQW